LPGCSERPRCSEANIWIDRKCAVSNSSWVPPGGSALRGPTSERKTASYDGRAAKVRKDGDLERTQVNVPTNPTGSHRARRRAQPLRVRGRGSDQLLGSVWAVSVLRSEGARVLGGDVGELNRLGAGRRHDRRVVCRPLDPGNVAANHRVFGGWRRSFVDDPGWARRFRPEGSPGHGGSGHRGGSSPLCAGRNGGTLRPRRSWRWPPWHRGSA
jgi:hypothetical protein